MKDETIKKEIIEMIHQFEKIIIHRHVRPDLDAYGSQCGLGEILKASFPNKKIYMVGRPAEALNYLHELDVLEDDVWNGALSIITDTANQERIDDNRYLKAEKCIKIDHHPNHDAYGDICWVDLNASATSEMIYELFEAGLHMGLKCSPKAARLLYAGIAGDTGHFLYQSTSSKTLQIVSELVKYDFDRNRLHSDMYEEPMNILKLQGYILENFEMLENNVGKIFITNEIKERFHVTSADASRLVSVLGNVRGIRVWAFFTEDTPIRVNLRSKGPIINGIAERYNGGGHPMASGANVASWEEAELLIKDLIEVCK
ncbi:MAG: bifunctional oligoribonuclease/PAP phosphatase NrnA [Bacillales bacterium]|nr:bifunctional oligoribonuclease/PAP phosphatase NrnA [Bacillales bacterium]